MYSVPVYIVNFSLFPNERKKIQFKFSLPPATLNEEREGKLKIEI